MHIDYITYYIHVLSTWYESYSVLAMHITIMYHSTLGIYSACIPYMYIIRFRYCNMSGCHDDSSTTYLTTSPNDLARSSNRFGLFANPNTVTHPPSLYDLGSGPTDSLTLTVHTCYTYLDISGIVAPNSSTAVLV